MTCQQCGGDIPAADRHCPRCGADRPPAVARRAGREPSAVRRLLLLAGVAVTVVTPVAVGLMAFALGWVKPPAADPGDEPWDVAALVPVKGPAAPDGWAVKPAPPPVAALPAAVRLPAAIKRDVAVYPLDPGLFTGSVWGELDQDPVKRASEHPDRGLGLGRFDRRTGEPAGPPRLVSPDESARAPAVSRSGAVAQTDPRRPAVWVYPADGGKGRPIALPPAAPGDSPGGWAEWLGWAADGTLLVIDRGRLAGYDAAGRRTFQADGEAAAPAAVDPAGRWLVARTGSHLEARDAATGKPLGRVGGEGGWEWVVFAPDGGRFAASRRTAGDQARPEVHVWDAGTGNRLAVVPHGPVKRPDPPAGVGRGSDPEGFEPVRWVGRDLLVVGHDDVVKVIDVEARLYRAAVWLPRSGSAVQNCPDGRFRLVDGGAARVAELPTGLPEGGRLVFAPALPVKAAADTGDPERDRRYAELLAAVLTREGYTVAADGGWTVRLVGRQTEDAQKLTNGTAVPVANTWVELLDPTGSRRWQGESVRVSFLEAGRHTERYVEGRTTKADPVKVTTTTRFDFLGRDPKEAMAGAAWAGLAGRLAALTPAWPRGVWQTPAGDCYPLPLSLDLKPDAR